jgi:hypothetical protein
VTFLLLIRARVSPLKRDEMIVGSMGFGLL